MQIKKLGRLVTPFVADIWDAVKYEVVLQGNRMKFNQNRPLMQRLQDTGRGTTLAEAASNDRVWGIGLNEANARKGHKWKGLNLLGKALMQVRDEVGEGGKW